MQKSTKRNYVRFTLGKLYKFPSFEKQMRYYISEDIFPTGMFIFLQIQSGIFFQCRGQTIRKFIGGGQNTKKHCARENVQKNSCIADEGRKFTHRPSRLFSSHPKKKIKKIAEVLPPPKYAAEPVEENTIHPS